MLLDLTIHGLAVPDAALLVNRAVPGIFFAISGYHKLRNPERHARLVRTLQADNIPWVRFNQWWVPGVELVAGLTLTLGIFSALSAILLLVICMVACASEAGEKVAKYQPIDAADVLDDYLYLPEVLYTCMLSVTILAGPGAYAFF